MQLLALEVKASWGWGLCWNTTRGPVQANPDLKFSKFWIKFGKYIIKIIWGWRICWNTQVCAKKSNLNFTNPWFKSSKSLDYFFLHISCWILQIFLDQYWKILEWAEVEILLEGKCKWILINIRLMEWWYFVANQILKWNWVDLRWISIPYICPFFSTYAIFGFIFLHTKVRKSRQNRFRGEPHKSRQNQFFNKTA